MTVIKKIATVVVTAVLATGVLAGTSTSADAAPKHQAKISHFWDTGWG